MTNPTVQSRRSAVLAILLLVVGFCPASLFAQVESADDPMPVRDGRGELIRQLDLDVRLIDDDGKLVPLLGHTIEDVLKLQELARREKASDDDGITLNGSVELSVSVSQEKRYGLLDVTYKVEILQRGDSMDASWIPVPLRLDKAIIDRESIQYDEPDKFFLDKDKDGYVGWIHAKPKTEYTIRLQAKIVIAETGGTRTLDVKLPNLRTTGRVVIPRSGLTIKRFEERSFVEKDESDDQTTIKIDNAGGGVNIGWNERPAVKPLVEVRGTMRVDVHANHVSAEAKLVVRSRGEPIDSFVVYMPQGIELTSLQVPGFQIATSNDPNRKRQEVAVRRIEGATFGAMELTLRAESPELNQAKATRLLQVAGFEVKDADLQLGTIDVAVKGNWSVTWKPDSFVQPEPRVVDADETAVTSRFLYDRQPFSLQVELRRKLPRVRVMAEYIVHVGDTQADLDAKITYETTGIETGTIKLNMAGWTVQEVRLGDTVLDGFKIDDSGILTLPVDSSATTLDIHVLGQQSLTVEGNGIAIQLPRPIDPAQPPSSTLLVLPSESVELTPRVSEMKWLVKAAVPSEIELPSQATTPFFYREELSADTTEPSLFVARKRIRSRTIEASVVTTVGLRDTDLTVEQETTLAIAYGETNQFVVDVPSAVTDSGTLQFTIDGETAPHERIETGEDASPTLTRVNVNLLGERTGNVVIRADYTLAAKDLTSTNTTEIPLLQPAEGDAVTISGNVLNVAAEASRAITLADEGWTRENATGDQPLPHNQLRLRADGSIRSVSVRTSLIERQSNRRTSVSRVWLQTIVSSSDRWERVVFRLVSDEPQLAIQLPASADTNGVGVAINGQEAEFSVDSDLQLLVTQPEALLGRDVALEISYGGNPNASRHSTLQAALPKLQEAERIERVYWEVLLPRNRHLTWSPASVTPELVWSFENLYWGSKGRLNQRELEELLAASPQDVPENMNRYLFSATGVVLAVSYTTVDRFWLMLGFSIIALLTVVPFFYLAPLRQPPAYFAIGLMLTALAVTFPEPAVLFGQAGAIGIVLALLACVLRRVIGTQHSVVLLPRGRIHVAPDSQPSGPAPVFGEGSSRATTATASAHLQVGRAEVES